MRGGLLVALWAGAVFMVAGLGFANEAGGWTRAVRHRRVVGRFDWLRHGGCGGAGWCRHCGGRRHVRGPLPDGDGALRRLGGAASIHGSFVGTDGSDDAGVSSRWSSGLIVFRRLRGTAATGPTSPFSW